MKSNLESKLNSQANKNELSTNIFIGTLREESFYNLINNLRYSKYKDFKEIKKDFRKLFEKDNTDLFSSGKWPNYNKIEVYNSLLRGKKEYRRSKMPLEKYLWKISEVRKLDETLKNDEISFNPYSAEVIRTKINSNFASYKPEIHVTYGRFDPFKNSKDL